MPNLHDHTSILAAQRSRLSTLSQRENKESPDIKSGLSKKGCLWCLGLFFADAGEIHQCFVVDDGDVFAFYTQDIGLLETAK